MAYEEVIFQMLKTLMDDNTSTFIIALNANNATQFITNVKDPIEYLAVLTSYIKDEIGQNQKRMN